MSLAAYAAFVGDDPEWEVTGSIAGFDPLPELGRLEVPALVVTGGRDGLTTPAIARRTQRALGPGARLAVLDGSAHRPWAEEPDAYFALVSAFLDETLS
jgi:pimeloyl-ACP methyl ester carboxylesterase